jgi:hypothetical protein
LSCQAIRFGFNKKKLNRDTGLGRYLGGSIHFFSPAGFVSARQIFKLPAFLKRAL